MTREIKVCMGTGCISSRADLTYGKFKNQQGVKITGCQGICSEGPLVQIDDIFYTNITEDKVPSIIQSHIIDNTPVKEYFYKSPVTGINYAYIDEIPYFKQQTRLILRNCGKINPEAINDYKDVGGYQGLQRALKMSPEDVIQEVIDSGLRGRGGAGFPTGLKWEFARSSEGEEKYTIVNADEGDPGAFMDMALLEGDPHSVIEGIIIGSYAIGASQGLIYIRAEYPLAVIRFRNALKAARKAGYLGRNILGSTFSFEIKMYEGAGAFVCGEETALIKSVEGGRGIPRPKPPFPATSGLWGKPTNINNVKSWSAVSYILKEGADKFRNIGTEKTSGTAIFSLTGKVRNTGVLEVPMGTTLREIIFDIGGGIIDNKKFKAVQTGGPSGGVISEHYLDTPVEYETMSQLGSIMGSGGMVVIDEDTCIVDFTKFFINFTKSESCGQCTPCREGLYRVYKILEKITSGDAVMSDLDELETLAEIIKNTSLCGLGQTAPNPILSSLRYFKEEYKEHIVEKKCNAGVCPGLFRLKIHDDACKNCGICQKNCAFDAIRGDREHGFVIIDEYCTQCRTCLATCPYDTIDVLPGGN